MEKEICNEYRSPEIQLIDVAYEGFLCSSKEQFENEFLDEIEGEW